MNSVTLCDHITESSPYAGLPDNNNNPAYLCAQCTVKRVSELVMTLKPAAVYRLMHVEQQHAREITQAMRAFTYELKQSDPSNSLVRNRCQCVGRYILNAAGFGTSKQERFQRYRVNQDDGRGPSYLRTQIILRLREPKSLSNYSDVVAFNRVEVTA